eukprot:11944610-Prorocentrum_lima.AAC.1
MFHHPLVILLKGTGHKLCTMLHLAALPTCSYKSSSQQKPLLMPAAPLTSYSQPVAFYILGN